MTLLVEATEQILLMSVPHLELKRMTCTQRMGGKVSMP